MSDEHVFSDWMGRKGLLSDRPRTQGRFRIRSDWSADKATLEKLHFFEAKRAKMLNWRVRAPCVGCNNGWMSEIVREAAPTVERLVSGETFSLVEGDRELLLRWLVLTTMMGEFDDPDCRGIPEHELVEFKATLSIPYSWTIVIGRQPYEPKPIYRHIGTEIGKAPEGGLTREIAPKFSAQITTLRMGHLFVNVASATIPWLARELRNQMQFFRLTKIIHPLGNAGDAIEWPFKNVLTENGIENIHLRIYSTSLQMPSQLEVTNGPNYRPPQT